MQIVERKKIAVRDSAAAEFMSRKGEVELVKKAKSFASSKILASPISPSVR
jgi:hypothetical protein